MRSSPLPRMSRRGRVTIGVLVGVFLLFTLLGWGVEAWTDWLWFDEVGYTEVFTGVLRHPAAALPRRRARRWRCSSAATCTWPTGCGRCCGRTRRSRHALERYRMVLAPAARHLDRAGRRRGRALRRPVRAGPLAAVAAVPQRRRLRRQGPASSASTSASTSSSYPFWRYLLGVGFTAVGAGRARRAGRALPLRRGAAAGRRRPDDAPRARAHLTTLVAVFVLLKAVAYVLDRRALLLEYNAGTEPVRRRLHRHQRAAAGQGDPRLHLDRGGDRDPRLLQRGACATWSGRASRWPCSASPRWRSAASTRWAVQTVRGQAEPARTRRRRTSSARIEATRAAFGLDDAETHAVRGEQPDPAGRRWPPTPRRAEHPAARPGSWSPRRTPSYQQVRGFYDFGDEAGHRPVHGRRQDRRTTWSASGRSTTAS